MPKNEKFAAEGYTISIVGKNIQVSEAIRNYVIDKLSKVERLTDQILDVIITLEVQKLAHTVTIVFKFSHFKISVHATTEELYAAIDKATEKLSRLIRKYKTKLNEHRIKDLADFNLQIKVLALADETEEINEKIIEASLKQEEKLYKFHKVVKTEKMPLKLLTQNEAVMKMELSGDPFIIFKGEEDQKLKVIFRREDEEFGIMMFE